VLDETKRALGWETTARNIVDGPSQPQSFG